MTAKLSKRSLEKKKYYNRVRRCCTKHNIEIRYYGTPRSFTGVELVKDGKVLADDWDKNYEALDINWSRIYAELMEVLVKV